VEEVTGQWRKLHNEALHDSYCSPNKIRVIKSRRMSWTGHVAYMGREEVPIGFWWGNLKKGGQMEDLHVDGKIILKMYLQDLGWEICTGLIWLRRGASGSNETSVP
jgi:hypothetical protein